MPIALACMPPDATGCNTRQRESRLDRCAPGRIRARFAGITQLGTVIATKHSSRNPRPMQFTVAHLLRRLALWPLPAALTLVFASSGYAADAHRAVQAQPGDIVVLRNVSTRTAYRPAPPGMALMVSPSPRSEITASLGTRELSDEDFAQLDAAPSHAAQLPSIAVGRTLDTMLVRGSGSGTTVAGNGVSNTIAAPVGAVGDATRGIGNQVQGALSQLPFGSGH